jgi:hypothetical protein
MKSGIVHNYRITFGDFFQKAVRKPVFKKTAVCRVLVTSGGKMYCQAKGGNDVHALKPLSAFDVFNGFSAARAAKLTF